MYNAINILHEAVNFEQAAHKNRQEAQIREGRIEIQSVRMQSEAVTEIIHALWFNKVLRRNKRSIISADFPKCQ